MTVQVTRNFVSKLIMQVVSQGTVAGRKISLNDLSYDEKTRTIVDSSDDQHPVSLLIPWIYISSLPVPVEITLISSVMKPLELLTLAKGIESSLPCQVKIILN
ncbi:hypothetical protein COT86_01240 [Candidatus Collierbacteria bacterium CG10_big_fil_rev_8_21_14_0_10_43_36]|uniref:Uncharacterized protein n=1 Tax=Candidatus Collierbacteria bacterium CG10_big_fil_rev_8_21_14_0_10_43_36 TaxID=1974534 RepID=A0A2H0VLG0_9BACT|nr:hypothetical protein [bacterium]PIR99947.1 MAG: hypothetical protein COT86_01240 [Candidatus Collierbacteria bacterium CG10_big_fil_rev_8_21_14_0_10_43_36]